MESSSGMTNSTPEAPDTQVPWFDRILGSENQGQFALGEVAAEQPWWAEVFVEPLGFLALPGFLWAAGGVPEAPAGPLMLAGFAALALGSSLSALARQAREARGPASRSYWRRGSGAILLLVTGLASLMASTLLFVVFP